MPKMQISNIVRLVLMFGNVYLMLNDAEINHVELPAMNPEINLHPYVLFTDPGEAQTVSYLGFYSSYKNA